MHPDFESCRQQGGMEWCSSLKEALALRTLTLGLRGNKVGESGVRAPALRTLTLDLAGNNLGPCGAQALAGLKRALALHTISPRFSRVSE